MRPPDRPGQDDGLPGARPHAGDGEEMQQTQSIQARLRDAAALPEILAVSFDAFEAIRLTARSCTDRIPQLFAAFMTAVGAATEGREAITAAPSLPPGPARAQPGLLEAGASVDEAIGVLASLAAFLERRLTKAGTTAAHADRLACKEAAAAARRICQLIDRGDDAAGLR
jgi:hypothetical protein